MKVKEPFLRTPYNYDRLEASDESGLKCEDESLTVQSQAQDADINVIMKRFGVTGVLPQGGRLPTYGDFSGVSDYREALDAVRAADAAFLKVDPKIRARFGNDPAAFVDFCSDPANLPELRKMGLAPEVEVADGEERGSDASGVGSRGVGDRGGSESQSSGESEGGEGRSSGSYSRGS